MRNLTLFIAFLLITSASFAQKGVEIGVVFTPGTSWILQGEDFDQGEELDFKASFGYNVGLTLGYNITERFGIASGVIFNKHRQNYKGLYDYGVAGSTTYTGSRRTSYIRVPIYLQVSGPEDQSGLFFRIGPHFDFLTGAKGQTTSTYSGPLGSSTTDTTISLKPYQETDMLGNTTNYDVYKRTVVGLTLEFGGKIRASEFLSIPIMIHLEGSLTNTETSDSYRTFPGHATANPPVRRQAWNVMGGLTIGLNYVISTE